MSNDGSRNSPTRDGQSPSSSRRSSIASVHGPGAASREGSTSATPKKVQLPEYERLFPPFFVKAHTGLASWNRFCRDDQDNEDKLAANVKLDRILGPPSSTPDAGTEVGSPVEPDSTFLAKRLRKPKLRSRPQPSVKEIVAQLNGTVHNPIDLTIQASQKVAPSPIDVLREIPTKFLKFYEDVRPPYIGTYTQIPVGGSVAKLSRNPFTRALPSTNYDYDSEAEWEEPEEGEDLNSEGEEEVEDDDAEDMKGFWDDGDADEVKKRRPIIGSLEPTCTGLCWEDHRSNIHRTVVTKQPLDLTPFRLDIILGE